MGATGREDQGGLLATKTLGAQTRTLGAQIKTKTLGGLIRTMVGQEVVIGVDLEEEGEGGAPSLREVLGVQEGEGAEGASSRSRAGEETERLQ